MARKRRLGLILACILCLPGIAIADDPRQLAIPDSQLEKLRIARSQWEQALSLEEMLPKVRQAQRELISKAPHIAESQTRIYVMELIMSYEQRCNSKRSDVNGRPFWFVEIGPRTLAEGGGLCLYFDAITGEKLHHKLTE